ncbi:hypothetical protein jhhlp_006895 [Lomentospora prolificans]|uniref:Rab-GAP TBC domain-containing protein n=1 Tax=Lomentospora prolificans TaxID=41688 RepID=A0A2N3N315_9PEZI|nr:hypothetical protein jhhlp_006895 [Lomentospora prolificans]
MPSAAEALQSRMPLTCQFRSPRWQVTLNSCSSLASLQRAVRYNGTESPAVVGCRSLCWKTFLLFKDTSPTVWIHSLAEARESYSATRDHLLKYIKHPEDLANLTIDPLADDPNSPWITLRQDEAIREEIAQDVRRLPDEAFYHEGHIQTMIIDILFIYCKLNPSVGGYRQGMHELLAPIVYVVSQDAVRRSEEDPSLSDSDRLMFQVLDSAFIEHDAFTLFSAVMDRAAAFYEVNDSPASAVPSGLAATDNVSTSVIVDKSKFIHEVCLKKVDPQLAQHLTNIEVLPQIFLIRWIRLLFSREFPFDQLLSLWDTMLAVDPRLDLIDLICVAMLLRIRWELLEADYSVCLQLLLKYPTPASPHGPNTFVEDAMYLKDHLNSSGATSLLMKYTGRVPQITRIPSSTSRPNTPSFPTLSGLRSRALSPRSPLPAASRLLQQQGGVEALFQGAAKNVLERSEKLGINQAVRDAMGEIRRNMQNLQENRQHPLRSGGDSAFSSGMASPTVSEAAVKALERRNKQLAGMLEESLSGLRAVTQDVLEDKVKSLEMIEIAASKAQVVKLCLEDSSIDIPGLDPETSMIKDQFTVSKADDTDIVMDATQEAEEKSPLPPAIIAPDPIPAISTLSLTDPPAKDSRSQASSRDPPSDSAVEVVSPKSPERPKALLPNRSSIAQSSFAWMLEPDTSVPAPLPSATVTPIGPAHSSTVSAGVMSPFGNSDSPSAKLHKKRPSGNTSSRERNAFLFGEVVPSDAEVGVAAGVQVGGIRREDIFGLEPITRKKE